MNQPPPYYMVFDVESVGLHGEGFAVGWVVVNRDGETIAEGSAACQPDEEMGTPEGLKWVQENVRSDRTPVSYLIPREVRDAFWSHWMEWKAKGAVLVADCAWPVEARFLAACVDDDPEQREWQGPYPLHELASFRFAGGLDPLGTNARLPNELPVHDALADARQSARLLIQAFDAVVENCIS